MVIIFGYMAMFMGCPSQNSPHVKDIHVRNEKKEEE